MVRRDEFREDLVYEQAAELIGLEDRLHEVEALLNAAATSVRRTAAVRALRLRRAGPLGPALLRELRPAGRARRSSRAPAAAARSPPTRSSAPAAAPVAAQEA